MSQKRESSCAGCFEFYFETRVGNTVWWFSEQQERLLRDRGHTGRHKTSFHCEGCLERDEEGNITMRCTVVEDRLAKRVSRQPIPQGPGSVSSGSCRHSISAQSHNMPQVDSTFKTRQWLSGRGSDRDFGQLGTLLGTSVLARGR